MSRVESPHVYISTASRSRTSVRRHRASQRARRNGSSAADLGHVYLDDPFRGADLAGL